jgi:hypothetical protein
MKEAAVARQRLDKHAITPDPLQGNRLIITFPLQQTRDVTMEELLETVFSMKYVPRLRNKSMEASDKQVLRLD